MGNTCYCENPPGGSITCPEGQIPICRVRGGEAHSYCLAAREDLSGLELTAWFVSHLVGKEVTTGEIMARKDLAAVISEGRFVNKQTGEIVTFTIPQTLEMPLSEAAFAKA